MRVINLKYIFCSLGFIFENIRKIIDFSLKEYKTFQINKHGSKALWIGPKTIIRNPNNIHIGLNTYVSSGLLLAGERSKIIIGENCLLSNDIHIRTDYHLYKDSQSTILEQGHGEKSIEIGDDVWIGHGVQIMPGVKVGMGAVLAAGSVVTKNVPDFSVVAGVPARVIKFRSTPLDVNNNALE